MDGSVRIVRERRGVPQPDSIRGRRVRDAVVIRRHREVVDEYRVPFGDRRGGLDGAASEAAVPQDVVSLVPHHRKVDPDVQCGLDRYDDVAMGGYAVASGDVVCALDRGL